MKTKTLYWQCDVELYVRNIGGDRRIGSATKASEDEHGKVGVVWTLKLPNVSTFEVHGQVAFRELCKLMNASFRITDNRS